MAHSTWKTCSARSLLVVLLLAKMVSSVLVLLMLNIKDFVNEWDSKATAYDTWRKTLFCGETTSISIVLLRFSHGFSRAKCYRYNDFINDFFCHL